MATSLDFSSDFVISSGTVSVDLSRGSVLALYHRHLREFLLPKGRKNIGETLEAAALRETMEESGYRPQLLEHDLPNLATSLDSRPSPWTTEPIAVQQRMNRGVRKIMFWYLAGVDSSSRSRSANAQEEGEEFDVHWVPINVAAAKMTHEQDREIVDGALTAVARRDLCFSEHETNGGIGPAKTHDDGSDVSARP
ncbi:MAG: hypothetical protein M1828_003522 [Chrysothrix sp. TS-e1954]|nr:MAG: hypothetical protein M1828_003522 [Chrysothrix sp. TS-e1954]